MNIFNTNIQLNYSLFPYFNNIFSSLSGSSYTDLQYLYRVAKSTVAKIIPETCDAIYTALKNEYMKVYTHNFIHI